MPLAHTLCTRPRLAPNSEFAIDYKDEAVRGALILDAGKLVWPPPPPPPPSAAQLEAQAKAAADKAAADAAAAAEAAKPKTLFPETLGNALSATAAAGATLGLAAIAPSVAFQVWCQLCRPALRLDFRRLGFRVGAREAGRHWAM